MSNLKETILLLSSMLSFCLAESSEAEAEAEAETSEEEEEFSPLIKFKIATSIFLIITVLLILSSFFEFLKDKVIEKTPDKLKDVIDVLFSEMTVLGFLSLVTFIISKAGTLANISESVFGELEDGEDFLEDLLESVHYDLFLVMVLFIIQTLAMINLGNQSEKEWTELEKKISDFKEMQTAKAELADLFGYPDSPTEGPKWWEFRKKGKISQLYRLFEFASLKKEFIHGRATSPPFPKAHEKEHLDKDFRYSSYLTVRISKFMADVINMNVLTWLLLEIFLIFFYIVMSTTESNPQILMWVWVGMGYAIMLWMYQLKRGAKWMREMHINPEDMPCLANHFKSNAAVFHRRKSFNTPQLKEDDQPSDQSYRPGMLVTGSGGAVEKKGKKKEGYTNKLLNRIFKHDEKKDDYESVRQKSGTRDQVSNHEELLVYQPWRMNTAKTLFGEDGKTKISAEVDFDQLPGWCHIHIDLETKRSGMQQFMFGKAPNRQEMLYFFQTNGPESQKYVVRMLLFMHAVYFAVLVLEFYDDALEHFGWHGFFIYFFFGFMPTIAMFVVALPTIRDIVHMMNIGVLRSKKDIAYVIRESKTKKALKSLILLKQLQSRLQRNVEASTPQKDASPSSSAKSLSDLQGTDMVTSMVADKEKYQHQMQTRRTSQRLEKLKRKMGSDQYEEVSKIFDLYDNDGSGQIDSHELRRLMISLGKTMDEFEAKEMLTMLDIDGDGQVSKEEFLLWHIKQLQHKEELTPEQVADSLFSTFDDDDSGSITVGEFNKVLSQFQVGLEVDDIAELARELDIDGDGTISKEEFTNLLVKHKDEIL